MAVNMKLVEKAYNAIYDYVMNKCENKEYYEACVKDGITSLKNSSIYFGTNDLFDVMIELKEAIAKNVAESKGSGGLRKAMLNVLKRTDDSRPQLKKAYVEDEYTMVCDAYVFIRTNREVDIPKHDKYAPWLNWKGLMPRANEMREVQLPNLKQMKEFVKLNAKNERYNTKVYGKNVTFYDITDSETGEILTRINTKLLLDVLEAFDGTTYSVYIGRGTRSRTSSVLFENTDGESAVVCPMRVE